MLQVVALGEVAGIDLLPLFRVPRLHFHLLLVPLPMVGVWPPLSGEIRFDGAALADYERRALGASIGYLPQDVELFDGTVADNIARFGDADPEGVIAAARLAFPLSFRKSAIVLKSGASRPVSHISSILRCASRSSRRLD